MTEDETALREQALRRLLGLPLAVPMTYRVRAETPDWHVVIRVGTPPDDIAFDLTRTAPEGRWFRGVHFAVSYRRLPDGQRPSADPEVAVLMERVRSRIRAIDARGLLGPWGAVAAAFGWVRPTGPSS